MANLLCILSAWILLTGSENVGGVPPEATPVYRFWSPAYDRYFYTLSETERDYLLARYAHVWTYDGAAFRAFPSRSDDRLAPVHRFWSMVLNTHFYTIDEREADNLIVNYPFIWTYEGVAFYAYPTGSQPAGALAVHRFWSNSLGAHFYATNDRERFTMHSDSSGLWQYEGRAYHVYPQKDPCDAWITKGPVLQWVTPESVTILWETDIPADSHIRYGVNSFDSCDTWDRELVTLHKVVLTGLAPDTCYVYTAASGSDLRAGSFTTAVTTDQAFRFAVYSDTQWDPKTHAQIVRNILDDHPRIVFHAGDLVSAGRDLDTWETEFFEPAGQLLANVPVIPVPGNHAYFGSGAPWFCYYFDRPVWQTWFALTYGSVRFVGLDTSLPFSAGSPQYEWLLQEFASPAHDDATWCVIILHEPPFTATMGHGDNLAVQEHLVPLFERYGVGAVFSGHSHAYERYTHQGICYIVTGGGGGPLYSLLPDKAPPIRQFGRSMHHHCSVDVDPAAGSLTITAVDSGGQVADRIELRK